MSSAKKRAAPRPPTNGVSSPVKGNESSNSSNGTGPVGDEFIDKTIELTIVLPNQSQEKIHILPSTALFDLRTQLCGKYKLNPSSHKLEPVDKNGRAISCTSSSTIESTEAVAVHLIPKIKDAPKITPVKTVEQTVRLTVKTSQSHQQVVRVKPNVPLRSILSNILDKTNSSKENQKYLELRHPLKINEALDLSKSLDEYNKLREVFVVDTRAHIDSDPETVSIHTADEHAKVARDGSTKKKKKIKSLFKFGKKKSKGQIVSPTSTSPPVSISEAPEFYNEKGVDTESLENKRPTSLTQSTSQQNESLHGQVSGKTQEKKAQRSSEDMSEDGSDVKKAPVSPPARPIAPPRIKSRAPVATTRPHTTGKKKAPAPPTPSLPKSPAESNLPASPTARPDKPPRRQSIEKQKSVNESLQPSDEADGEREQDVVNTDGAAVAATTAIPSVDGVSISSAEELDIEIGKGDKLSEGRLTPDGIDNNSEQVSDAIQISHTKNVETVSTSDSMAKSTSDEETNTESTPTKDDVISHEEETPKESERVIEIEEPVVMTSSENADVVTEPSQKQEIPTVPDNAVHHVITPGLGLAINDVITEDDLQDLSDSEIPVIVDEESDTDEDLPNQDENKMSDVDMSPPVISDEEEKPVTPPAKLDQELPPPTSFKDDKSPSPPIKRNEDAPTFTIAQEVPSPTLLAPTPSPVITEQTTTMSQQPIVEEVISRVAEDPPQPPPLKDDDNLFTTPPDYNVYEEPETDMASIETQALAMLQRFTTPPPPDDLPTPVMGEAAPAEIEIKPESKVSGPPSVVKEVVPASAPAKETEFKAPPIKQDVDEPSDEQTKEEIAKLKAQLEAARQKLAQREAEAEYARKNPYTIVPEPTSSEPGPIGKRKTFTFLPTQRPARSFEDYETAPKTVISITKGGDIRGMVLVKDRKPEEKLEERPSASNVQTVPTKAANSTAPAATVVGQPPSKTTVPFVKKAAVNAISTNNNPRSDSNSPTVASIMVNHLQSKPTRQEIPDVKIVPSQTIGPEASVPQANTEAIARKPKVAGGYVGSAILKQPATMTSKPSVPPVYDWTSNKKSTLPNYYKRFLGIDAVTGTNKAVDKFKSNVEEKKTVSNGYSGATSQGNVGKQAATPSPLSPTKPAVATKPVSVVVKPNYSNVRQSSSSAIAASLNKALNPSPITSLPLPPEEKRGGDGANNYEIDVAPLPPPPEEFLSSPTSSKNASLTPGYVGISSAKPFGSSSTGGPKFRPMSAAFKQDDSNSNPVNGSQ